MGNSRLATVIEESLAELKRRTIGLMYKCDALRSLCQLFGQKITEMSECVEKGLNDTNLEIELELRLVCNILINFLLYTNDEPSVARAFIDLDNQVEETCFKAI